jgi:hypothetical protein
MTTSFRKIAALAVVTLLYLAIVTGVTLTLLTSGAAGQQAGNATSTPQPIEGTVGPVEILDYRAEDGEMILTLRTDEHTPIAVSDSLAGLRSSGVTQVPVKQRAITPGRTTIRLPVTEYDGAVAVTISTPNQAVRIQTEPVDSGRPPVPFDKAALGVVLAGVGSGWYAFRRAKEKFRESDQPEVNRVA